MTALSSVTARGTNTILTEGTREPNVEFVISARIQALDDPTPMETAFRDFEEQHQDSCPRFDSELDSRLGISIQDFATQSPSTRDASHKSFLEESVNPIYLSKGENGSITKEGHETEDNRPVASSLSNDGPTRPISETLQKETAPLVLSERNHPVDPFRRLRDNPNPKEMGQPLEMRGGLCAREYPQIPQTYPSTTGEGDADTDDEGIPWF
jgi:hypothetical protein